MVENTQAHYFDNLISKLCASVLINDDTVKHQVSQCNALFLATFSEPTQVFVRTTKWKSTATFHYNKVFFILICDVDSPSNEYTQHVFSF